MSYHTPIRQTILGAGELVNPLKSKLLVEPLSNMVVLDYNKFDSRDALIPCCVHQCHHQPCPQVLALMSVGDRQAEGWLGLVQVPQETPADNPAASSCDQVQFCLDSRSIVLDDHLALLGRGLLAQRMERSFGVCAEAVVESGQRFSVVSS